ncbi:putative TIM-barrel fold metal-dependent hydrolase [Streptomyces sp. 846.5]|nr:amidohydrolase family protein [Streptomyces sp. 846.5]TDU05925.1 putative TIM-barrel fold metal-dependent hydrolase [Streptomyces sp. 846.5]
MPPAPPVGTGLVDVHAHFVTDDYVAAATAAGHAHPDGLPYWPAWSPQEQLHLMDEQGITTAMLSMSSPGTHFGDDTAARKLTRQVNEYGADLAREHPRRFGQFASLPLPDVDGALAELAYALDELKADGVALMTNAAGRYLGDPAFDPVWAELDRRRAVVFVHPTSPPDPGPVSLGKPRAMLEFLFDSARTAADLVFAGTLTRYPDIQWVFTHGGGVLPLMADRMELFRSAFLGGSADDPTVQELAGRLWYDIAGTPFPHQVPALAAAFGTARILYGSDYCWTPAPGVARQIAAVDAAPTPPGSTDWRTLTTGNAHRLLPRLA